MTVDMYCGYDLKGFSLFRRLCEMPKYRHWLTTRIGTCRSGTTFDIPHDFKGENIEEFLYHFDTRELVDILCMTEAIFSRRLDSAKDREDVIVLWHINKHIRSFLMSELENDLKDLRLSISSDFVRHGLNLLLG
jgi:hypothetical protein